MTTRSRIAFTLLLTATLGCPSKEDPKPVAPVTSTAAGGVTVIRDAMFGKIADCMKAGAPYVDFMGRMTDDLAQRYQASVDAGRITYRQLNIDRCLLMIEVATCAQLTPGGDVNGTKIPVCEQILMGSVALDGACTWNAECQTGWCRDGGSCPFTCASPLNDRSVCSANEQCIYGACDPGLRVCVDGRPAKAGDPCSHGDLPCEAGLYCKSWTCTAQVAEGQPCTSDPECLSGLGCADDGNCRPLVAVGDDCSAAACGYGAFCSAAAGTRCADDPWRAGDGCAEYTSCWNGLHCNSSYVCMAGTVAEGGACDPAADLFCVEGTWCSAGTCTAYTSSGTVCP